MSLASPWHLGLAITAGQELQAPHLQLLDRLWQRIDQGDVVRAIVSMPPRSGKTQRLSRRGPAWYLNRHPDHRIILASYEADFASSHGRAVRDSIKNNPEVFAIRVSDDSSSAARWDIDGHAGGMVTAGVGGAITGRGGNVVIVDDPVKNAEEALSHTYREKAWDWWRTTAYTRLEPAGSAIVIMTRWHEDDLAGKILAHMGEAGEQWEYVKLPALAEENDLLGRKPGEALWPERYPVEVLETIRQTVGGFWFSAMYQGSPSPVSGGLFKREWFRTWRHGVDGTVELDDGRRFERSTLTCFTTVDLAASLKDRADFTVASTWWTTSDADLIWVDCEAVRLEGPDQVDLLRRVHAKWQPSFMAVEKVGYQLTFIQAATRAGLPISALDARGDKVAKALTASTRYSLGKVFHPAEAHWLNEAETQLLGFPNAAHDDIVDTVSFAAIQLSTLPARRKLRYRP